jgi:hypothetical protein
MANIFCRRSSLPMVLKAALNSKPTTATTFALAETQAAWAVGRAMVHDLPFRKQCCDVGRMLFAFMKASRSSMATVSSTLDKAQRMATGLYDAGLFLAFPPPLYTGWISAVLKAHGNTPGDSNMFTRCEMGPAKTSDPVLRTATGIPSVPSTVMTFEIRPAFAKLKDKVDGIFPLVSPLLGLAALSRVPFSTPLPARIHYVGGLEVPLCVNAVCILDRSRERLTWFVYRSVLYLPKDGG